MLKSLYTGVGAAVLDGVIYAVGGFDSENRLQTVESYTSGDFSWKFMAPLNTPRSGAGVTTMNGWPHNLICTKPRVLFFFFF